MNDSLRLLRETPDTEQPRARLAKLGASVLSLTELLHIALEADRDPLLPFRLFEHWDSLAALEHASASELRRIPGMTPARVARLQVIFELARRMQVPSDERPVITQSKDVANLLMPEMGHLEREQMRVVLLNTKNRVIGTHLVYQGSVHTVVIRVSELFREAVRQNATAIIVAHNHPSGDPSPSPEDVAVTREVAQAGKLLDIGVLDHLVIGNRQFVSLKERGLGFG